MEDLLERLGEYLIWKIGKDEQEEVLVVRTGMVSASGRFAQLPRLRSASDQDVERLMQEGRVRVEWVE
jgi:hypothetical protein